mgnify:CR=1 FL=1
MTQFRNIKQISSGQWLDVLFTSDSLASADDHKADISKGWGIAEGDLEVVDGTADARSGTLISSPTPPKGSKQQYSEATSDSARISLIAKEIGLT